MVTGTPGTGKTAASKVLSERLGCHHVELSELSRNGGFIKRYDEERDTWIVDLKGMEDYLEDLSRIESSLIVLDGHLAHLVSPKASTEIVFILRCCPEELERRLRGRGYPDKKVSENILSELLDTVLVEALDRFPEELICEVDVTGRGVAEVVDEMLSVLEGRKGRCFGEIDWIAALSDEGRIGDLLRRIEGGGGGLHHPGLR